MDGMNKKPAPTLSGTLNRAATPVSRALVLDFFVSISNGTHKAAEAMLDAYPELLDCRHESTRMTPLIFAAKNGNAQATALLIARGADMEAADNADMTALMAACAKGQGVTAALLVENGACVTRVNKSGLTAESCAYGADFPSLAETMRRHADKAFAARKEGWKTAAEKISSGTPAHVSLMKPLKLRMKNKRAP